MAQFDGERLDLADRLRRQLAIENELSRPQARAFVRCLQTSWDVPRIQWSTRLSNEQMADARRLLHAAEIFTSIEGDNSARAIDCYRRAGEILEWLSRADDPLRKRTPIELLAAAAYQLGRLPAMATALLGLIDSVHAGVRLYAAFLRADFDSVLRLAMEFWSAHPDLTTADASGRLARPAEEGDEGNVAWFLTVDLLRSLGLIADCMRRGDQPRLQRAIDNLQALDALALRTFSDDASLLVSLLRHVAESFQRASIHLPLAALAALRPDRRATLDAYARGQFSRGRGILWVSQLHGLQRLIDNSSFALCTPTGSGKTLVANLALLKELLLQDHGEIVPLAIYLVPSRALAGEVEAKLGNELGEELIITGLYGGSDWGVTDYWLKTDKPTVLIATVEKADALMRYLGPLLLARLRLLIIDEAHQVVPEFSESTLVSFSDHSNRAIRLESLVARMLSRRPDVVRIALTAVAGGAAGPVAKWVEGHRDAHAVGVRYRSTRQVVGILETTPSQPGQILLDIMNGKPLYLRGADQPVYLPLRVAPMPQLPAEMRNSLNCFNSVSVLWTALHLAEEDQRILISVAQEPEKTMRWFHKALALASWSGVPAFRPPEGALAERFEEAKAACRDYCGADSFELSLLERGIATSHGQMPQRLRRLMVEMIDKRICPITVATATLTEGVNLPFDLIFLTSLKRRSWDAENDQAVISPMSTSEFRNLAGRAGRPGASKGIEGLTLVALPTTISTTATAVTGVRAQQRQQREWADDYERLRTALLIEEQDADDVAGPLALLIAAVREKAITLLGVTPDDFESWLEAISPSAISDDAGKGSADRHARLADSLDELDSLLLSAIEEINRTSELAASPAEIEAHLAGLWAATFTAVAETEEFWLEQAFIRRGRALVETIYPDPNERGRLYHYGFSPVVGRRFAAAAPQIRAALEAARDYGILSPEERQAQFAAIGLALVADRGFGFRIRDTETDRRLLVDWFNVLGWWLQVPGAPSPAAEALRSWQRFVSDNLEFRLGVAIGAVVAEAWADGAGDPMAVPSLETWRVTTGLPWFGFWARELLRWGTHDPFVAFALSQGIAKTRDSAAALRSEFDLWLAEILAEELEEITPDDRIDPQRFNAWMASRPRPEREFDWDDQEDADLTGTDGRRGAYRVLPIHDDDGGVRWMDPAGFELAYSEDVLGMMANATSRNDYELRTDRPRTVVTKTYTAPRLVR